MPSRQKSLAWAACILVAAAAAFLVVPRWMPKAPKHQVLATRAMEAYEAENFDEAIRAASACVEQFGDAAGEIQEDLRARQAPEPPIGQVAADVRERILSNGPLNDVAASLYFLGRSLEKERRSAEALGVHRSCSELTYARCWDPDQRIFWNPAEMARYRVEKLEGGD